MSEAKKKASFLTGIYPGKWCWLVTPNTRFSEDGEYSVDLVMSRDDAVALCKQVGEVVNEQAAKVKHDTPKAKEWKLAWPVKDAGEDEPGMKLVTFKQKIKPGYDFGVDVFDAHKRQIKGGSLRIGNGSKLRVSFYVRVVADSLNSCIRVLFHPRAAQIIELVPWEADYGFEETDGFTADAAAGQVAHGKTPVHAGGGDNPIGDEVEFQEEDIPF